MEVHCNMKCIKFNSPEPSGYVHTGYTQFNNHVRYALLLYFDFVSLCHSFFFSVYSFLCGRLIVPRELDTYVLYLVNSRQLNSCLVTRLFGQSIWFLTLLLVSYYIGLRDLNSCFRFIYLPALKSGICKCDIIFMYPIEFMGGLSR